MPSVPYGGTSASVASERDERDESRVSGGRKTRGLRNFVSRCMRSFRSRHFVCSMSRPPPPRAEVVETGLRADSEER